MNITYYSQTYTYNTNNLTDFTIIHEYKNKVTRFNIHKTISQTQCEFFKRVLNNMSTMKQCESDRNNQYTTNQIKLFIDTLYGIYDNIDLKSHKIYLSIIPILDLCKLYKAYNVIKQIEMILVACIQNNNDTILAYRLLYITNKYNPTLSLLHGGCMKQISKHNNEISYSNQSNDHNVVNNDSGGNTATIDKSNTHTTIDRLFTKRKILHHTTQRNKHYKKT